MKKFSIYILVALCAMLNTAMAQVDRSTYPEPGPAPVINIGDPATFTLPNGLKVFVVENHKLPRVTYSLILDRDPILEGDKAGTMGMVGPVIRGGTTSMNKEELDEAIDRIGGSINVSATSASAASLKKHNARLLELFSDVLFNPSFPEEELTKTKTQTISGLAAAKDDPNSIISVLSSAVLYGKDHPYGESETEETIENIQMEDIKNYYETYFRPNIAYLAIVGDITVAEAKTLVNQHFANWESREVPQHTWKTPEAPAGAQVNIVNRPASQQSVIDIRYPIELKPNSPDVIATSVIGRVLGGGSSGRLFMNLREDKGYTYGAYGGISSGKLIGTVSASASVGTGVTDSATHEFLFELDRLAKGTITQEELDLAKAALAGSFGRSLEQPATIANFALNTEIQNLPADYYKNYLKNLEALTLEEVNALARKYVQAENLYINIVGNADGFADKMATYGEVNYYTVNGDPEVKVEITDADLTPEKVINRYLDAIGGRDLLKGITTIKSVSEAEIQGMTITIEQIVDQNKGIAIQNTKMGGQVLAQVRVDNGQVVVTAQGQRQELPEEMGAPYMSLLDIFPELYYVEKGYAMELDGISSVNGENAYTLKVQTEAGSIVEYYSVESGLKLKSESATTGEMTYGAYESYDGLLYPASVTQVNQMLPMPVKAVVSSLIINGELTADDLK